MERIPRRLFCLSLLAALLTTFAGCQSGLFTALYLIKGTDVKPKYDILRKGEKRVAVVCRSLASNSYEVQNAPRLIAAQVSNLLYKNVQNKKLKVVEPAKIEAWLDDCNNDFDNFVEVGRDKSIEADIVIGIEIYGFQIRDPHSPYMVQGNCQLNVKAFDCKTGEVLASENLTVIDPPNMPISGGPGLETAFRPQFIQVVSQQIAILFHDHDPNKSRRMDADNLEMHRIEN
ncbi:MAG: hypothetical protein LBN39_00675 [Planctomycetaceae bacterium]|jgi:hypothetical protein|nr:hypothetical protein [Planctomycetaceae bacterium]